MGCGEGSSGSRDYAKRGARNMKFNLPRMTTNFSMTIFFRWGGGASPLDPLLEGDMVMSRCETTFIFFISIGFI